MIWSVVQEGTQCGHTSANIGHSCTQEKVQPADRRQQAGISAPAHTNSVQPENRITSFTTAATKSGVTSQGQMAQLNYELSGPFAYHASTANTENKTQRPLILVGLAAICSAVGAGEGTVKRWIREDGFPARRCSDGTYRADPEAVRRWFAIPIPTTQQAATFHSTKR